MRCLKVLEQSRSITTRNFHPSENPPCNICIAVLPIVYAVVTLHKWGLWSTEPVAPSTAGPAFLAPPADVLLSPCLCYSFRRWGFDCRRVNNKQSLNFYERATNESETIPIWFTSSFQVNQVLVLFHILSESLRFPHGLVLWRNLIWFLAFSSGAYRGIRYDLL